MICLSTGEYSVNYTATGHRPPGAMGGRPHTVEAAQGGAAAGEGASGAGGGGRVCMCIL